MKRLKLIEDDAHPEDDHWNIGDECRVRGFGTGRIKKIVQSAGGSKGTPTWKARVKLQDEDYYWFPLNMLERT